MSLPGFRGYYREDELARAVYVTNDQRAAIKKRINTRLGSTLVEEKSYADYQRKA